MEALLFKLGTTRSSMRRIGRLVCLLALHVFVSASLAQSNAPVQYFYDDLGRLIRVVDTNGNVATYNYDAVGNLLSITRATVPANNGLAVLSFSPQQGPVGFSVTIRGQGFNSTLSANTVQFNGAAATVTSATANALVVTVPAGATTGPISVTVGGTTASSDTNFTVVAASLTSIAVSPIGPMISSGLAQQFTATGTFNNGTTQDLTTSVIWSSSNTGTAAISNATGSQGLATGGSDGLATIRATSGSISGSTGLTVRTLNGISITPSSASVLKGSSLQFTAHTNYRDGTGSDVTANVTWSSSNPSVATISNSVGSQGLASTLALGSVTITASFGGFTNSASLNVISLTSITVTPANSSIPKGTAQQFGATANYTDGSTQNFTKLVTWSSSNSSAARVSNAPGSQGFATSVAAGTTTLTATYGAMSGSATLTVTAPVATSIVLSPSSPLLPPGGSLQLKAVAHFTDGTTSDVTSSATWSSSNTSIATVSNQGLANAVADGSSTITAALGSVSSSASLTVTSSQIYQGTLYAADGQTPVFKGRSVKIYDVATGTLLASAFSDANGFYQATGNPPGSQGLTAQTMLVECSYNTVSASATVTTAGQPIIVNLTLPLAIVTGKVSFYDGTAVPRADVFLTSDQSCYGDSAFNEIAVADGNGNYIALPELKVGAFNVFAEDVNSGLFSSTPGNLTSIATHLTVDVNLPPTGTVRGSVFDSSGTAIQQGSVQLFSTISEFEKNEVLPSGNSYQFDQVPVGTIVVAASTETTGPYDVQGASASALGTGGQQVTLNVNLQPTSTVGGTVYLADGSTPVASARVVIENPTVAGGIADFYHTLVTSPSGSFSLPNVPVGSIRVAATAPDYSSSGVVTGTLTQNNALILNPIFGNAVSLSGSSTYKLSDVNSFVFDIDCYGEPVYGGYPGAGTSRVAYSDGAFPFVNIGQVPYGCAPNDVATFELAGRQLVFGPRPMAGNENGVFSGVASVLQTGRKVFVPQNGGFARYLEILTNPLSTPVTATFEVDSYLRPFYDTLVVDPAQNGNTFSVIADSTEPSAETLAYAFGGGGPVQASSGLSLFQDAFSYKWTITVPANQTVILMHFLVQRAPGDIAGATSQAQALVNLTDPNALAGMTAQEKAEVINFNVP